MIIYNVTAARHNADGSAEVQIQGRWCRIGGRATWLQLGASVLNDEEGPLWRAARVEIPENEELGISAQVLEGMTADAVVVVLARRAFDAERSGWTAGPVNVPSAAEAEAELALGWTPREYPTA